MTAVIMGLALLAIAAPVPYARANHETVPWTSPRRLDVGLLYMYSASVYDNGSHGLYTVVQGTNNSLATSFNLTFLAESDGPVTSASHILYRSQPNDEVGGVGTASFSVFTGIAQDAQGRVYVAWVRNASFTPKANYSIDVSTSLDHGHTWSRIVSASAASDFGADFNPVVRVGPDGRVWVAYLQAWGRIYNVTVAASSDHGVTFPQHWNATGIPGGMYPEAFDFAIDSGGRLHVVYSVCTSTSICSLAYVRSDDGITWSAPFLILNGSLFGAPFTVFDPSIAIARSTVNVGWYDTRLSPTGYATQHYARSPDRGATWSAGLFMSQGTSQPFSQGTVVAAFGDTVMAVWGSSAGLSWAVSADGGLTWSPEIDQTMDPTMGIPSITVDSNGTFHVVAIGTQVVNYPQVFETSWDGPPDPPAAVTVASLSANSLRVNWTAPPQGDVATYDIWRSPDGSTYALAGTVPASNRSWTDAGLSDGTYWYRVTAVDATSHVSHDSIPVSALVGPPPLQGELDQILAMQNLLILLLLVAIVVVAVETVLLVRVLRGSKPRGLPPQDPKP